MKAVDTPVLLALLEGSSKATSFVRASAGEELATTELNLFELELLARRDRSPGRDQRIRAIERLRRRLTVLPIDEGASRRGAALASASSRPVSEGLCLAIGSAESHGAREWVTSVWGGPVRPPTKMKVVYLEKWKSNK